MKIAINKTVINKPDDEQIRRMTYTYENVDITPRQLAEYVAQGYAFCAQHKNNERKTTNFIASDFLAVDIDDGMTLEQAFNNVFIQNYASFVYTTPSHTDEFPKFRIVFALKRTITDSTEMKHAYSGIVKKFGGDPSCTDACRQFFGSKSGFQKIYNKVLPTVWLDKIILLGKEAQKSRDSKLSNDETRSTIRSRNPIDENTLVVDKSGEEHRLIDLPAGVPIHCPVHIDKNASAFTLRSKNGVVGIHCSKCCTTYFTSGDMPLYDFNYGLTNLKSLKPVVYQEGPLIYEKNGVTWMHDQYLPPMKLDSQYIFVKSPKGSGKTQWLEHVVKQCEKQRLSVLLIGHRQSLISSIADRLGLMPYIDYHSDTTANHKPSKYYAICADSLPKLLTPAKDKYDVVLIDEVEQVLSHLTERTVKDKRNEVFLYFKHYVRSAKTVYVMDADLNKITVDAIANFGSETGSTCRLIVNDYQQGGRSLDLYQNQHHLRDELTASLSRGEKCFVCSNSKRKVGEIEKSLVKRFGNTRKILSITSDNSNQLSIQEFIRDIKNRILEYDAVIVSPSVGTGVDITFPNNESRINCVYGFFEARVNTHFDIDQQISRVRHPKSIKIWISPEKFRFEHDSNIIKNEVLHSSKASLRLIGIDPDGTLKYEDDWSREYLDLYANVVSMKRGSKNNLIYHFKKMKQHYGWTVNEVAADTEAVKRGSAITKEGRELQEEEKRKRILNAKVITRDEYNNLENFSKNGALTPEQTDAMRRYEIESFYYRPVTEDLIKLDDDGKFRHKVRLYEEYTEDESKLKLMDLVEEKNQKLHITDTKTLFLKKKLLRKLFCSAGLADENNNLIIEEPIMGDSLSDFVLCFKENKNSIARFFNMDIRKDIDRKPAQQLGALVRMIGISWDSSSRKENGKKIYQYRITQSSVDKMEAIVSHRKDSGAATQWYSDRAPTENRTLTPYETYIQRKEQILQKIG